MLDALPPVTDERLLSPVHHAEDAGAVRLGDGRVLLATTDFFTPVVDDPADFGRIAAANALSDIYAMGAEPLGALNIACYPESDYPLEYLIAVLRGGQEKMEEAGALLLGGHTVTDTEFKYGLAVFAICREEDVWHNSGAEPGDFIALTKPLGSGILATALKAAVLSPDGLEKLVAVAARLNRYAARVMRPLVPRAVTDVTGFGLVGHALEVGRNSGVRLEIAADALPLISPEVLDALDEGHKAGGLFRNRRAYTDEVTLREGLPERLVHLAHDPQTSGGLLFFDIAPKWPDYERAFAAAGEGLWRIGEVTRGRGLYLK